MRVDTIILRTILLYFILLVMIRIMGKRELGQLSPFDFVVSILIAELAAIPMEDETIPLMSGVIPIVTLVILQISLSYLTLHSERIRKYVNGAPSILIKNGEIQLEEMRKSRCTMNDLLTSLREKDIFDLTDVEFAVMEPSGHLTVLPKSQKRPVTPSDLNIPTAYEGIPMPLIVDGNIHHQNLCEIHLSEKWLYDQLAAKGVDSVEEVLYACINTKGEFFLAKKN